MQAFQKIPISHLFYELENLFNQSLNLRMNWKKLCPKFSFTVENKIEHSHKKGWSHFKLND